MRTVYARLDEAEFRKLVSGKIVELPTRSDVTVSLILADIGWDRILEAVSLAISEAGRSR